jgi:hypothetical protein
LVKNGYPCDMKTIILSAKCSDLCSVILEDMKGHLGESHGYVPKWLPNPKVKHYGDYVQLKIDIETGKILNWKVPTQDDLDETFKIECRK